MHCPRRGAASGPTDLTSPGEAEKARRFTAACQLMPPLRWYPWTAAHSLGVSKIWIKDESKRFGLNAFKALGGSYAMARCLSEKLGKPLEEMSFEELCAPAARRALGDITFVTATDGNHGRGVAWAAPAAGPEGGGLHAQGERGGAAGEHPRPGRPRRRSPSITMMTRSAWRTGWRRSTAGS